MNTIDKVLKKYFGHDEFLPGQRKAIESILGGNDTMAIFPTGGGKSICYQIPALLFEGTTIVISPLISLMKDQVDELLKQGIPSTYISSAISDREIDRRIEEMKHDRYKIVYIAPERFYSDGFIDALTHVSIPFVAIDEAHCISQWGHNFRPAYLMIRKFISHIGNPVLAAFTATANSKVQRDIVDLLAMKDCNIYINSFDRPNLQFKVEKKVNKKGYILKFIRSHPGASGIIYASTRKNVEKLFMFLKDKGIDVGMYHGGLSSTTRNLMQEEFIAGDVKVMVATNAFGMGIDKEDVRYVIHYNMPKSVEDYYQEAGRAGRDGKTAQCILLYSDEDMSLNKFIINANYPPVKLVKTIYRRVKRRGENGIYLNALINSYSISHYTVESAIRKLVEHNYIRVRAGFAYIASNKPFELTQESIDKHKQVELDKLSKMQEYCQGEKCLRLYILNYFNEEVDFKKCYNCSVCGIGMSSKENEQLDRFLEDLFADDNVRKGSKADEDLLKKLKTWREGIADRLEDSTHISLDDMVLREIATLKPMNKNQLLEVKGFTRKDVEYYGDAILEQIYRHIREG